MNYKDEEVLKAIIAMLELQIKELKIIGTKDRNEQLIDKAIISGIDYSLGMIKLFRDNL